MTKSSLSEIRSNNPKNSIATNDPSTASDGIMYWRNKQVSNGKSPIWDVLPSNKVRITSWMLGNIDPMQSERSTTLIGLYAETMVTYMHNWHIILFPHNWAHNCSQILIDTFVYCVYLYVVRNTRTRPLTPTMCPTRIPSSVRHTRCRHRWYVAQSTNHACIQLRHWRQVHMRVKWSVTHYHWVRQMMVRMMVRMTLSMCTMCNRVRHRNRVRQSVPSINTSYQYHHNNHVWLRMVRNTFTRESQCETWHWQCVTIVRLLTQCALLCTTCCLYLQVCNFSLASGGHTGRSVDYSPHPPSPYFDFLKFNAWRTKVTIAASAARTRGERTDYAIRLEGVATQVSNEFFKHMKAKRQCIVDDQMKM